ncbi:MAG: hypothetical protein V3575_01625 [Candidatus Absconditabacteria bacterium]
MESASNQEEMFVMLDYLKEKISSLPGEMDSIFNKAGLNGTIKRFGIENSNTFFVEDVNGNKITLTPDNLSDLLR